MGEGRWDQEAKEKSKQIDYICGLVRNRLRLGALKGLKHPGASPRRNGHGHVGSGAAGCRAGAGEAFPALLFLLGAGRDPVA